MVHTLDNTHRLQFQSIILLESLANYFKAYTCDLKGDDKLLLPLFNELVNVELVERKENVYCSTAQGKEVVRRFLERKQDCDQMLSVYSAVNLQSGEFAWEKSLESLSKLDDFLNDEQWIDLRLAAAEFKKLNVLEVGFLIFFNREKLDFNSSWQKTLLDPRLWNRIEKFCNNSTCVRDLDFKDWEGTIPGEETISNIIKFGAQINKTSYENSSSQNIEVHDDFDLISVRNISKETLGNYLKADWVAPCWNMSLHTGMPSKTALKYYW